jgi:uncharacterized membrane protein
MDARINRTQRILKWLIWIKNNPILIYPIIGILVSVVFPFLNSFSLTSQAFALILLSISIILYEYLSCQKRIKEITANTQHVNRLKDKLIESFKDTKDYNKILSLLTETEPSTKEK